MFCSLMNERRDWNVCLQVITRDGSTKLHRVIGFSSLVSNYVRWIQINMTEYVHKWMTLNDYQIDHRTLCQGGLFIEEAQIIINLIYFSYIYQVTIKFVLLWSWILILFEISLPRQKNVKISWKPPKISTAINNSMFVDFGILTCANEHLNNVPVILKIDWLSIYTEECNNCLKSLKRV